MSIYKTNHKISLSLSRVSSSPEPPSGVSKIQKLNRAENENASAFPVYRAETAARQTQKHRFGWYASDSETKPSISSNLQTRGSAIFYRRGRSTFIGIDIDATTSKFSFLLPRASRSFSFGSILSFGSALTHRRNLCRLRLRATSKRRTPWQRRLTMDTRISGFRFFFFAHARVSLCFCFQFCTSACVRWVYYNVNSSLFAAMCTYGWII